MSDLTRKSGNPEDQMRQPVFATSEEDRRKSFEEEDRRWATNEQVKDWIKLAIMCILTLAWHLIMYFFTPGLR